MQGTKRRDNRVAIGELTEPHQYVTWCNHLYPAQALGSTLASCNSGTIQVSSTAQNIAGSGTVQVSSTAQNIAGSGTIQVSSTAQNIAGPGSSFSVVGHGAGMGSTIRNAIVHAPGAVRDYLIGAGQSLNLFPVYSYETFQTSDREALTSDVVVSYRDVNQALVNHWTELVEIIKSKMKEEGPPAEVPNVEQPRKGDTGDRRAVGTEAGAGID
jgi:hypothetical protein